MSEYKTVRECTKNRFFDELLNHWGLIKKPASVQTVIYLRTALGQPIVITPPYKVSTLMLEHPVAGAWEVFQVQLMAVCLNATILEVTLEGNTENFIELVEQESWGLQKHLERINAEYKNVLYKDTPEVPKV